MGGGGFATGHYGAHFELTHHVGLTATVKPTLVCQYGSFVFTFRLKIKPSSGCM